MSNAERDAAKLNRIDEIKSFLSAIVESSDDAIIGKTLDGIITSWNKGAEKIYGYTAKEAVGKPISILVPPNHHDELPNILQKIKDGKNVEHFQTIRLRKDGRLIHVSLTISPIKGPSGSIISASSVARDITLQKLAEENLMHTIESLERFQRVTVDRELKMKELKAKIAELEEKLKRKG